MPSKGTRLKDVLDGKPRPNDWIVDKFLKLHARIHSHNPNLDNDDYNWVKRSLEDYKGGIIPTTSEIMKANELWKKYQ